MIPAIGFMIGWYIITRMVELYGRKEASRSIKILAVITIIVALYGMLTLFTAGTKVSGIPLG